MLGTFNNRAKTIELTTQISAYDIFAFQTKFKDIIPDLALNVNKGKQTYYMCVTRTSETGSVNSLSFSKICQIIKENNEKKAVALSRIEESKLAKRIKSKLSEILQNMEASGKNKIIRRMAKGDQIPKDELSSDDEALLADIFLLGTKRKEKILLTAYQHTPANG